MPNCLQDGKITKYVGESGCSWWDRSREHAQALKSKNTKYTLVKHWLNEHTNLEEPPIFKSAIHRQISESIIIENQDQTTIINGKGECGTNKVPRYKLTLENQVLQESEGPFIQRNIPKYTEIYRNIPKYTEIYQNIPKYT